MDPETCLDDAESALAEGDYEAAAEALDAYREWCDGGGFGARGSALRVAELEHRLPVLSSLMLDGGTGVDRAQYVDGFCEAYDE